MVSLPKSVEQYNSRLPLVGFKVCHDAFHFLSSPFGKAICGDSKAAVKSILLVWQALMKKTDKKKTRTTGRITKGFMNCLEQTV